MNVGRTVTAGKATPGLHDRSSRPVVARALGRRCTCRGFDAPSPDTAYGRDDGTVQNVRATRLHWQGPMVRRRAKIGG
jgi:hypothetical protein